MQVKSHIVTPICWGVWGGFVMWLCAISGWNNWSSTSTSSIMWGYIFTIFIFGYCGYVYTPNKPPAVRMTVCVAVAILGVALNWLSKVLGVTDWINDGTMTWHAAVGGFVIFAISSAMVPYVRKRTKT